MEHLPLIEKVLANGLASVSMEEWFAPYAAAHKIVFIRFGSALDYLWFGGQNYLLYATTAALLLGSFFLYLKLIRRAFKGQPTRFLCGVAVVCFWWFSSTQFWNWLNPQNLSWFVAHSLIVMAVYALSAPITLSLGNAFTAVFLCVCAGLTLFSGIPALLVVTMVIFIRNRKMALVLLPIILLLLGWLMDGVHTQGSYFAAVLGEETISQNFWYKIPTTLWQAGIHLGTPVSRDFPIMGFCAAALSALFVLFCAIKLLTENWLDGTDQQKLQAFSIISCLILLAIILSLSLGRNLSLNIGFVRYQTIICHYWLNITLLVLCLKVKGIPNLFFSRTVTLMLMLPFILYTTSLNNESFELINQTNDFYRDGLTGQAKLSDYHLVRPFWDDKNYVEEHKNIFAKYHNFRIEPQS